MMDVGCIGNIDINAADARYKLLFECAYDMIFLIDFAGKILDANYSAVKAYGYTHDQLLAMNVRELRVSSERAWIDSVLKDAFTRSKVFETVHQRKDRSSFPVEISMRGINLDDRKLLLAVVRDISARKEAERTQARLAAIVNSSRDTILGMTLEGIITEWNHGAELNYGYAAREVLGRNVALLVPQDRRSELTAIIEKVARGESIIGLETQRVRKNGEVFPVLLTASPICEPRGKVIGVSWIGRDISLIRQREQKLKESESRFRQLFDSDLVGIAFADRYGGFSGGNDKFLSLVGYTREDLNTGLVRWDRMTPPELLPEDARHIGEADERGSCTPYEKVYIRKDGSEIPVIIGYSRLAGTTDQYILFILDITKRKQAEESQRESQQRLEAVFKSMTEGVLISDAAGNIISFNDAALHLHRFAAPEQWRKHLSEYAETFEICDTAGRRLPIDEWPLSRTLRGETFTNYEVIVKRKDMDLAGVWSYGGTPIRDPQGSIFLAVLTIEDITERKRTEEQKERLWRDVEEQRARLQAIMDSLPVAVLVGDTSGRVVLANSKLDTIFGGTLKAPRPESIEEYVKYKAWWADTGKPLQSEDWPLARTMLRGEAVIGDVLDIERFDGTRGTILANAAPVKDKNGHMIGGVVVVQDITAMRQIEHELSDAKSQAELYVDLMCHDINNLNQAAMGYLDLALETLNTEKAIRRDNEELIERPLAALNSSTTLIENVRMLQRLVKEGIKARPVDLGAILEGIEAPSFKAPNRDITVNIPRIPHYMVEANELLRDVFLNLISNAIKHSDPGKPLEVDITVQPVEEYGQKFYRCTVQDNGPGIPDRVKPRLFNRFQRGDTSAHGKGLGLYLVRTLVEGYHGRVWVEDRIPGDYTRGSRFVVVIPEAKK